MTVLDFELIDDETIDNSIERRHFMKTYQPQGAQFNNSDQNVEFIFGEKNSYRQVGNGYLDFDLTQG